MDYVILDDGSYKINFTKTEGDHTLVDAIVLSPEEYEALTEDDINLIIQQRFDKYFSFVAPSINA